MKAYNETNGRFTNIHFPNETLPLNFRGSKIGGDGLSLKKIFALCFIFLINNFSLYRQISQKTLLHNLVSHRFYFLSNRNRNGSPQKVSVQ